MAHYVSPCCGDEEFTETLSMIKGHTESYICSMCKDQFVEPIENYEFDEQRKESIAEDREDEKRDLGW